MTDEAAPDVSTSSGKAGSASSAGKGPEDKGGDRNGSAAKPTGPGLRPSGTGKDDEPAGSGKDDAAARAFAAGAAARQGTPPTGSVSAAPATTKDSSSGTSEATAVTPPKKPAGPAPTTGSAPNRSEAPVSTPTSSADVSAPRPAAGRPVIQNRPQTAQAGPFVSTDRPAVERGVDRNVDRNADRNADRGGWDREPELAPAPQPTGRVARLTVSSVELMSVLKVSLMLSVAAGVALVIATTVLWLTLKGVGVFDQLNSVFGNAESGKSSFDIYDYIGFGRVLSVSVLVGAFNVLLLMSLSVIVALIYNISAGLVGGVRVTLSDE